MVTTWNLSGIEATYEGSLADTDGYKIVASITWQDLTAVATDLN
jgi:hypothetical protein